MPKEERKMSETTTESTTTEQTTTESTASDSQPTQADIDKLNAALSREREQRKEAQKQATANSAAAKQLEEIQSANASETEKAVTAARKEGEKAAIERVNTRLVRAEARALAAALGFTDPTDAVALVDLSEVTVDDDGEVDSEAAKKELADLAERKPYLLKAKADTSASDAGIGATGTTTADTSPKGLISAGLAATSKSK
jgi:hypothetical protein